MSLTRLILRSAIYHWRTNLAVVLGVAIAVSVLAGALLVGDSVRGSLRAIAVGRLGRADLAISSAGFFREDLAAAIAAAVPGASAAPLVAGTGFVTGERTGRRSAGVLVYGVDERFWTFHGIAAPEGVQVSPALAAELGVATGDTLLVRLQKPSEIPIDSLFGRKDEIARTSRLEVGGVLSRERLGEFTLRPQQTDVRAVFAPLRRIQRDLGVAGQANAAVVAEGAGGAASIVADALRTSVTLGDLGIKVSVADPSTVIVESAMGILGDPLETAVRRVADARGFAALPVFTYLANALRRGDRQVPYSLITAIDLDALPRTEGSASERQDPANGPPTPAIVLNDWAARELGAVRGDRIDVDYYLWSPTGGLSTHTAAFTLDRVVPIAALAADRRLAPEYPGITEARSLGDWDPPFPIDLAKVRPQDERYWDEHTTTPKAFVSYERGRDLWKTRFGGATSIRLRVPGDAAAAAALVGQGLRETVSPASMGISLVAARRQALEAASGTTDFGEYFVYFSFFLVVSALLLTVIFFRLGVEQRLRQIAILRASGFTIALVRRLLLTEAIALSTAGSALGVLGAIGYGWIIMYGLRTWWVGAVGTTLLELHVSWTSLAAGALGGIVAAAACVVLSLRAVARLSPRALLTAQAIDAGWAGVRGRSRLRAILAGVLAVVGLALVGAGLALPRAQVGYFFGAGASLLVSGLLALSWRLRARADRPVTGRGTRAIARLGFRSASFRPARSVLSAALIASAAFIIVSIDAFRRDGGDFTDDPQSGTGGFALLAQSEVPLVHDPNDAAGREALVIQGPELGRVHFTRFRLKPGDDASCLNLYRPSNPTLIAPEPGFIERGRFAFAASLAESEEERRNPWLLLRRTSADGTIPVIADQTSLQYVLHAGLGDTLSIDAGGDRPIVLRFVASLADSVLQGQLILDEAQFVRLFPSQQGYRFFLIDAPGVTSAAELSSIGGALERELAPFGFDAVTTAERLAAYHRVENTYLSTFQALGGLGLLLGTIGLAAILFRNALERRRELALLRAVGFDARRVTIMIVAEALLLLGAGLAIGAGCAALAVAPAWLGRGGSAPGAGLVLLLLGVAASGVISSYVATRAALRGHVLEGLRTE